MPGSRLGEATLPFVLGGVEEPPPSPSPEAPATGLAFTSDMARQVYGELEPMAEHDGANGLALFALVDAIASMFLQCEEATRAREGFDAQTQTFDIDRTPAFLVPFVGQAAGVRVTRGIPVALQRTQVREGKAWRRGKLELITADLQLTLTGSKKVRYTAASPWQLEVFTESGETPNLSATESAGRNAKPYGIVMTFGLSTVPTIDQGTRTIDASTGNIDTATLADIT